MPKSELIKEMQAVPLFVLPFITIIWRNLTMDELYAMYLRKSRADMEAEARGEGETLSRHKKILTDLAKKQGIVILQENIYQEIVSGENIASRPQVQKLLADISERKFCGVLVMEIERLARGNTIDQGIVAQAFKDSETKIITPTKIYDPNNEYDEEYFEFSLFMSRREYKTIRRRMEAGRLASVKEGNYIITNPPYGYKKVHPAPKVYTLEIVPCEADVVRLIYDLYLNKDYGKTKIANTLNSMNIKAAKSESWVPCTVFKILKNPVYMGYNQWHSKSNGDTLHKGIHEAIVSEEVFMSVQEKIEKHKTPCSPVLKENKNYYFGVMYCGLCGHIMSRHYVSKSQTVFMMCKNRTCKCVMSKLSLIDEAVINALRYHLEELKGISSSSTFSKNEDKKEVDCADMIKKEIAETKSQRNKLCELLEKGLYDDNTFIERNQILLKRIEALEKSLQQQKLSSKKKISTSQAIINIENLLNNFETAAEDEKRKLLSNVFYRIEYSKTTDMRGVHPSKESDMQIRCTFI